MNFDTVMRLIGQWGGTLKYFPSDTEARFGIAQALVRMVSTEAQLRWLVEMIPTIYTDWPGVKKLRGILCQKFKPADGIEAVSEDFPDGLSSEQLNLGKPKQIAAPEPRQITGTLTTADPELSALVVSCRQRSYPMPAPPEEWTRLNPGETDLQGLMRMSERLKHLEAMERTRPATQAEIDAILAYQEAHRKEKPGRSGSGEMAVAS